MEATRIETDLPHKMAHLDIMEVDESIGDTFGENEESPKQPSRILRKRKSIMPEPTKSSNRRVCMKPRKHIITESASSKQIEALYLNKTGKTVSQTLETIYEEPKTDNKTDMFIGGRKVKRLLTFPLSNHYTKDKIKKRRAKIKKLLGNKSFLNRKKIPMQVFLKTIECLELDTELQTPEVQTESTLPVSDKIV